MPKDRNGREMMLGDKIRRHPECVRDWADDGMSDRFRGFCHAQDPHEWETVIGFTNRGDPITKRSVYIAETIETTGELTWKTDRLPPHLAMVRDGKVPLGA